MSEMLDPAERSARGVAISEEITGAPLPAATTLVQESWHDFIFAEIWSRPGLDRRARYLIAMSGAATGAGAPDMLDRYVIGALKSKLFTQIELREAALHLAVYGGWSRGGALDAAISRACEAVGQALENAEPIRASPWDANVRTEQGMAEFTAVMTFPGGPSATPFLEAINNFVFGEMWRRRALDERSRRWITLVGVCDSAAEVPIKSHIHAAMSSGNCTPQEMLEFVLQYGVHAGWPRASAVQAVVLEMSKKVAAGLPWNG